MRSFGRGIRERHFLHVGGGGEGVIRRLSRVCVDGYGCGSLAYEMCV